MTLKDMYMKNCYDSDEDDILSNFFIPALEKSKVYRRLAGFFNSSSLAVAARGIQGLLENNGHMQIIAGVIPSRQDVKAIEDGITNPEKVIEEMFIKDIKEIKDEFVKDHVRALAWMVAHNTLDIKLAFVTDSTGKILSEDKIGDVPIFHQKVGILEDAEGNMISFSGSDNESKSGWIHHVEEFKVFRNWIEGEKKYFEDDLKKFNKFWENHAHRTKILDIPTAIKNTLINLEPKTIGDLNLNRWYKKPLKRSVKELFSYQKQALDNWFLKDKKGIFEMATGTGKTIAALGCVKKIFESHEKIAVVVSCPYNHLVQQWKGEIKDFGIDSDIIIADSSSHGWKNKLSDTLIDLSLGHSDNIIVLTTHSTFSSKDFIGIIKNSKGIDFFLIGDEVHGLGAEITRSGLIEEYRYRLGLSATPKRWFDSIGTEELYTYFGGVVYELGLEKAINTINPKTGKTFLTPYRYIPIFSSLNDSELQEYQRKTNQIIRNYSKAKDDIEKQKILENLYFSRANVIKNAQEKFTKLEELLDKLGNKITLTIIYCTPQQIDTVMEILKKRRISSHRFTMDEETKPDKKYNNRTEREYLLQQFEKKDYQVLVAMKCLDEGVDIPPARTAILLASSGNPREYIQRIGRIIRRFEDKEEATIYDLIITPSIRKIEKELRDLEMDIFEKELNRYEEIAKIALNNADALETIYKMGALIRR